MRTEREVVSARRGRKLLRLDFAQLQKMAEVVGMIAAEGGGRGSGDPVGRHLRFVLSV